MLGPFERCQWHLRGRPPQMILVVWAVLRRLQRWLYVACDDRLGWVAEGLFTLAPSHFLMWSLRFLLCSFIVRLKSAASSARELRACASNARASSAWGSSYFPSISAGSLMGLKWKIKTGGRAQDLVRPRSSHVIKAPGREIIG